MEVVLDPLAKIDSQFFLWLYGLSGRWASLDWLAWVLVSDYFVPVSLSLLMLGLWFWEREPSRRERLQRSILVAAASLGIVNILIKLSNELYFRPRPFDAYPGMVNMVDQLFYRPPDSSFPSNPAAVGFAMATAIALGDRRASLAFFVLAALFSLARIYVGATYPLDIAIGALLGASITLTTRAVIRFLEPWPTRLLRAARRWYLA